MATYMTTKNSNTGTASLIKHYYRIVLSYPDFKHAWRCAQNILQFDHGYNPETDTLETALYCSMVVAYARPFNSAGTSRVGRVPRLTEEILKTLTLEEKKIHNYMLLCRNKLVAHSDAEYLDLEPIVATDISSEFVVPLKNDGLAPFTKSYTAEVSQLCEKLVTWAIQERAAVEPKVLPHLRKSKWSEIHGYND